MEELTPRAAAKKYGALIPPHVKIIRHRPTAIVTKPASRERSAERGDELLGVPDKHELYINPNNQYDLDYEDFMAIVAKSRGRSHARTYGRSRRSHAHSRRTKKMKKHTITKKSHNT